MKTVIFDMDGLLVDSEPLWGEAMNDVFKTVGVELSPELARQTTGLRTLEVVSYWHHYFNWKGKSVEQVAQEIIDSVTHKVIVEGKAMEGLHYILNFFKERDFKIGLASSSPMCFIVTVLQHLQIQEEFKAVYSAEFEPFGKPHPAVYLSCADKLSSSPLHCLAFEDSVNGMIAAKAARIKVVAVPEPHNRHDKRYALADLQLDSLLKFSEDHLEQLSDW